MLVRVGAAIVCFAIAGAAALSPTDTEAKMSLEARHLNHPLNTEVSIERTT